MSTGKVLGSGVLVGFAVGVGATLIGPALWRLGRPFLKDVIKAGATGYGAARLAAARAAEEMEDLAAEAAHELSQATQAAAKMPEPVDEAIIRG